MNFSIPHHLRQAIRAQEPWTPDPHDRLMFKGHGSDSTADDQLLDMWTRPNPELTDTWDILSYALTVNGYEFYDMIVLAQDSDTPGLFDFARPIIENFRFTGRFEGGFAALRLALFVQQRIIRNDEQGGHDDEDDRMTAAMLTAFNTAICVAWESETAGAAPSSTP